MLMLLSGRIVTPITVGKRPCTIAKSLVNRLEKGLLCGCSTQQYHVGNAKKTSSPVERPFRSRGESGRQHLQDSEERRGEVSHCSFR